MDKKNIIIGVLCIVIAILTCTTAYVIMNNQNTSNNDTKTTKENTNVLSNEEALKTGKEKYEYIREMFECYLRQLKVDNSKSYALVNGEIKEEGESLDYQRITNIDEYKNKVTTHLFVYWLRKTNVVLRSGEYYAWVTGCGGDPTHARDKYEMTVKKIDEDRIVYSVSEYSFVTTDEGLIPEEIDKANPFTNDFVLVKENNTWKISEYTDYSDKYSVQ